MFVISVNDHQASLLCSNKCVIRSVDVSNGKCRTTIIHYNKCVKNISAFKREKFDLNYIDGYQTVTEFDFFDVIKISGHRFTF